MRMLIINGNNIALSRGDDVAISFTLTRADGEPRYIGKGETVYFVSTCGINVQATAPENSNTALVNIPATATENVEEGNYMWELVFKTASTTYHATLPQPFRLMGVCG